jgi:hypothetical protein
MRKTHVLRRISSAALALATLPLVSGCPLVALDIELPEVCISASPAQFDGVGDVPGLDGEIALERSIDLTAQIREMRTTLADLGTAGTLRLLSLDLQIEPSPNAPENLDFVRGLELVFAAPDSGLPPLLAFACDDCPTTAGDLDLVIEPVDFLPYLDANVLHLDATIRGELPRDPWSMSVEACFSSTISRDIDL